MEYTPKILKNESDKTVEFRCGGNFYIFQPGEKKILDGFVAHHALVDTNTGLKDVTAGEFSPSENELNAVVAERTPLGVVGEAQNRVDFRQLSWKELVRSVKSKGYKLGMSKEQIYALLEKNL